MPSRLLFHLVVLLASLADALTQKSSIISRSISLFNLAPASQADTSRPLNKLNMVSSIMDSSSSSTSSAPTAFEQSPSIPVPLSPLSPFEIWWMVKIEGWYREALALKCPWMRRRMLDTIDKVEVLVRSTIIHPSNLDLVGPPMGCRGDDAIGSSATKQTGLSLQALADIIRGDWKEETMKGYYITGAFTPSVYRNDCIFDGPDPDLPCLGLRKFHGAASQLFDRKTSTAELIDLQVDDEANTIVARWRMNGVLRLPFKPKMPEVVGKTTYHLDEDNLVYLHEETWDLSAIEAFTKTEWLANGGGAQSGHH